MSTGRRLPVAVPPDATEVETSGPRPFLTAVSYRTADGRQVRWAAREHRRVHGEHRGLTWWIGLLFAVGSVCFVLGPVPAYLDAVGARATALTYFVGSLFFTTAAYLSFLQVVRTAGHRWLGWEPSVMGFWATAVQLVGTLYFNVMTFASLFSLDTEQAQRIIWRPDAIGSVCFLVSSVIAFAEAGHRWFSWRPGRRDWHITALNLWGSVFFGISAVGGFILPDDSLYNARWANGGTFLGAVCFLVAAILTMLEGRPAQDG
ncbi:MAG TPA: YrhK family protein [Nocardioides sp.]|uniref:hypothetical protein n=1 Tax=Nocardioides sp. TaxID=35761 RepID=UPI002B81B480|nr:hypothetical protein [Nocardioides sp.]HQR27388.1 YrhK family protein [Nocardioides sp.]